MCAAQPRNVLLKANPLSSRGFLAKVRMCVCMCVCLCDFGAMLDGKA